MRFSWGHASHIGQVFTNLLSNAADALDGSDGEAGRVRIAIYDEIHEGVPTISVIVEDSGPGIPDTLRQRVLEIFFTTKPSGKGTGLGLAITKRVLTNMKARSRLGGPMSLVVPIFI